VLCSLSHWQSSIESVIELWCTQICHACNANVNLIEGSPHGGIAQQRCQRIQHLVLRHRHIDDITAKIELITFFHPPCQHSCFIHV
jgi:hypothetical protein